MTLPPATYMETDFLWPFSPICDAPNCNFNHPRAAHSAGPLCWTHSSAANQTWPWPQWLASSVYINKTVCRYLSLPSRFVQIIHGTTFLSF